MAHFHHVLLPESGAAGAPPEWLHLIPCGTFTGSDGRGPFQLKSPETVIAASKLPMPLDECHSTDFAAPVGAASPARGWIVELQSRADGVWGRVEWCESGKQLVRDRAYRGISPVFTTREGTKEVHALLRASLTNVPNLQQLATLHQETSLDLQQMRDALALPATADGAAILHAARAAATVRANVREALGLAGTADDAAILHAARTHRAEATGHAASIAAIAQAAGAQTTDAAGLVTHLQAVRTAAGSAETMAAKIVGLETQLNTMKAAGAKTAAETYIDGAIAKGKPIASLRDHYVQRHQADAAAVEKEVGAMVSIHAGGMQPKRQSEDGTSDAELTAEEMSVCSKMGQDPKKFAEQKAKTAKKDS